jgi:hypothetical protein
LRKRAGTAWACLASAIIFSAAACSGAETQSSRSGVNGASGLSPRDQLAYLMIEDFLSTDQGAETWISQDESSCVPVSSTTLSHALELLSAERGKVRADCSGNPSLLLFFRVEDDLSSGSVGYVCGDLCGHTIRYDLHSTSSGPFAIRGSEIFY